MKKIFLMNAALLGVLALSSPIFVRAELEKEPMVEKRVEHLTKTLGLSTDQQQTVKSALEDQKNQMEALHKEFADKRKALKDSTDQKITNVLTPEQKQKFEKIKEEREERMEKRHEEMKEKRQEWKKEMKTDKK